MPFPVEISPQRVSFFSPQSLSFGGVKPNSTGPDINVNPNVAAVAPDVISFEGAVIITNAPADTSVTAHITGDTSSFRVRDVIVRDFVLTEIDPIELPHGFKGHPKQKVLQTVAQSDGSAPLAVKKGQFVLVRVEYIAPTSGGTFNGTLVIQSDTWGNPQVPLSFFIAEVTTSFDATPLTIPQGQEVKLSIKVSSNAGPETDVRYETSPLQLHTGISLAPTTVHVEQGGAMLSANLTLRASPDAPLGENTLFIDQFDFSRTSFLIPINIVPAPVVDLRPLAEQKIHEKYAQVGGRQSLLGRPIDSRLGVQSNGREFFTDYLGGQIVFTLEGGASAFVTHQTFIVFKGIHCFGKSEAVDEPYAIVGVYALDAQNSTVTKKFPVGRDSYEDFVSSTDQAEAAIVSPEVTGWAPQDLVIVSTVMEHDSGSPDEAAGKVEAAMNKVAAAAAVFGVPVLSVVIGILDKLGIPGLISDLFGMGDDLIGTQSLPIDASELFGIAKRPMQKFGNIEFNFESPLISDGDASYKLYYEVFIKEIPVQIRL